MTFSDELRTAAAKEWDAAVTHRFVDELWGGRLQPQVLGGHLVQEHQVMDAFVALTGAAVALADGPAPRLAHARRAGLLAGPTSNYLARAMGVLDVPLDDRTHPELVAPAEELRELMAAARRSGDYPACVTVLLATEWLHLDAAGRAHADAPTEPLQREWIELHRGAAVEGHVAFLRRELDRVAAPLDADGHQRIRASFTRAVGVHLAFLDTAHV